MTKKTVGAQAQEILSKSIDNDHSASEQSAAQLTDYEKNINETIQKGCADFRTDFFVVVLTKRERILSNVMRYYYFARKTCPTPQHEQVVYHYHYNTGDLEFLWVVPSAEACVILYNERNLAHKDENQLLQFVFDFKDGNLLHRAMKLNKELTV